MNTCLSSEFSTAVLIILQRWTALQICIEQQLAGSNSQQKVTQLHELITNFYSQDGQRVTEHALEESLGWFFSDMFNVAIEDGSTLEVARKLCTLYTEVVIQGNMSTVESMKKLVYMKPQSQIQAGLSDDSEDDDSEGEGSVQMDVERSEPTIDEDGFQLIQKGHKKH